MPNLPARIHYAEIWELQEIFLHLLPEFVSVKKTCEVIGLSQSTVRTWRKNDAVFRKKFQEATEEANEALKDEAIRRGYEGIDEPVFYEGQIVGYKKVYSDRMLEFVMKARMPETYGNKAGMDGLLKNNTVLIMPANGREFEEQAEAERGEVKKEEFEEATVVDIPPKEEPDGGTPDGE